MSWRCANCDSAVEWNTAPGGLSHYAVCKTCAARDVELIWCGTDLRFIEANTNDAYANWSMEPKNHLVSRMECWAAGARWQNQRDVATLRKFVYALKDLAAKTKCEPDNYSCLHCTAKWVYENLPDHVSEVK